MKRIALLALLPLSVLTASCSSKTEDTAEGGGPSAEDLAKNPIQGIAAAKLVIDTGQYTDGPVWQAAEKVLFYTVPIGSEVGLYRVKPTGEALKVRGGNAETGELPVGNAVNPAGELVTVEAKRVMRGPATGEQVVVANSYPSDQGTSPFDTLNDVVVHKNGTMFVSDPGYFSTTLTNRLYRIAPDGAVTVVEAFLNVPRPNGLALSPDQKTLYVGFEKPQVGTKPYIEKYIVKDDGTLAEHARFVEFEMDASPDGIEVDAAGNVYVANKAGITVFKADGKKVGNVAVPAQPTGMAFGGEDLKTLFVTTAGTKIFSLKVNVAGINQ